mmetsp:Transcript_25920/g.22971  ORF Transcript_25920/g.22971 Transcript_25920/m.22971 type:complete len:182 (-) Transcript_25920:7-552(-)
MDDHHMIVSTSMMQYLEEVDSMIRTSQVLKNEANLEDTANEVFEFDNSESLNLEFREDSPDRFAFLGMREDVGTNMASPNKQEEELERRDNEKKTNEALEEVKSDMADGLTLENHQLGKTLIETPATERTSDDKQKSALSNKERARRARQRKKKYYEDLEKRVEYLENKYQKLTKELDHCK